MSTHQLGMVCLKIDQMISPHALVMPEDPIVFVYKVGLCP